MQKLWDILEGFTLLPSLLKNHKGICVFLLIKYEITYIQEVLFQDRETILDTQSVSGENVSTTHQTREATPIE